MTEKNAKLEKNGHYYLLAAGHRQERAKRKMERGKERT